MNSYFTVDVEKDLHSDSYEGVEKSIPRLDSLIKETKKRYKFVKMRDIV